MSYTINNVQTVWLPFGTTFTPTVSISASWQEQVQVSDPNNVVNINFTGTGNPKMNPPKQFPAFTTPASYGTLPAYPVNVMVTNGGGTGVTNKPSWVISEGWSVTSWDQLNGKNNLFISFQPNF